MRIGSAWQRRDGASDKGGLGLAFHNGRWALAAVPREPDASVWTVTATGGPEGLADCWGELTRDLPPDRRAWPLCVVLPAGRALHRRIDLPQADDATTARLVSVQTEGWLAGSEDTRSGWEARDEGDRGSTAWVVAAPRDVVDAAMREAGDGPLNGAAAAAVSDAVALMHGFPSPVGDRNAPELIILSCPMQCTLVLRRGASLLGIESIEAFASATPEAGLHEFRDAVDTLTQGAGLSAQSLAVHWIGTDGPRSASSEMAEAMPNLKTIAESPADVLARGAARALLGQHAPVIWAEGYVADSAQRRTPAWAWVAAALAVLAAAGLWVRSDFRAADAVAQAEANHPELAEETQALRRQLNVLTYLESRPPTLLAIIDEATDKANQFNPNTLRYSTDGGLELSGVLRSADEIGSLVAELSEMRTLVSAQLRSQKVQEAKLLDREPGHEDGPTATEDEGVCRGQAGRDRAQRGPVE
ncbi:MAG: hypothetical protein AAGH92_00620, partial [Planctomycetota bacterium]